MHLLTLNHRVRLIYMSHDIRDVLRLDDDHGRFGVRYLLDQLYHSAGGGCCVFARVCIYWRNQKEGTGGRLLYDISGVVGHIDHCGDTQGV